MARAPKIVTTLRKKIAIVRFTEARILDESSISAIGVEFDLLVRKKRVKKVVLDFQGVDRLSSAVIGKIIGLYNRLVAKDGDLKLCGLNDVIREIFTITSLDKVFEIHDDLESALWSFQ